MLERGVREPSNSPWASLILLVHKKNGSTRFCVDYRKLNDATQKDAYPRPRIDTTLDALHGLQWFSTLALLSCYWQVMIDKAERSKTTFYTTEGLFQFMSCCLGCVTPPNILATEGPSSDRSPWSNYLVHLDDMIVLGRTFDKHLCNVCSVWQRMREVGLHLKCSFF